MPSLPKFRMTRFLMIVPLPVVVPPAVSTTSRPKTPGAPTSSTRGAPNVPSVDNGFWISGREIGTWTMAMEKAILCGPPGALLASMMAEFSVQPPPRMAQTPSPTLLSEADPSVSTVKVVANAAGAATRAKKAKTRTTRRHERERDVGIRTSGEWIWPPRGMGDLSPTRGTMRKRKVDYWGRRQFTPNGGGGVRRLVAPGSLSH